MSSYVLLRRGVMSAIKGVYAGLKPVKSRKIWVLEIEIPEEHIKHVTDIMGFPNQSESQWVGVTLLKDPVVKDSLTTEKSNNLRTRAIIMCTEGEFRRFCHEDHIECSESVAREYILKRCGIESRNELAHNTDAQKKFLKIVQDFKDWQASERYADNLTR